MSFSCESVARNVLPLYRAYVAKELVEKYGFTQVSAAKKLGTTQPAISQYLSSKRGRQKIANYAEILPIVQRAAAKSGAAHGREAEMTQKSSMTLSVTCARSYKASKNLESERLLSLLELLDKFFGAVNADFAFFHHSFRD